MNLPPNTYVVLDIPSPHADEVLAIRGQQQDFFRWSLPAETTVSGSAGTGPIATDESLDHVVAVLNRIAAETAPIRASFGPVRSFPQSDVFYLSFVEKRPLRELHRRIASSGLRFQATQFPFGPHCTLRTRTAITEAEARRLLEARVDGEFTLDTLTLYDLPPRTTAPGGFATLLCLLHRVALSRP